MKNFVSQGIMHTIDQSRRTRVNGRAELFRELRCKTACARREDKEALYEKYVRGFSITCDQVILVLLSGEFAHCIPPCPSLNVQQLEQSMLGS